MEQQALMQYLLAKPETTLDFPFGADVSVFKVKKKMFALMGIHNGLPMINLKCEPEEAVSLCDVFEAITPGYHMNKRHWISIFFDGSVPQGEIERLIDNSYMLVVKTMPKRDQHSLLNIVSVKQ